MLARPVTDQDEEQLGLLRCWWDCKMAHPSENSLPASCKVKHAIAVRPTTHPEKGNVGDMDIYLHAVLEVDAPLGFPS